MLTLSDFWAAVSDRFFILLFLALVDMVFGVVLALLAKQFEWERLTDYLKNNFLPIAGWLAVEYLLSLPQDLVPDMALAGAYWLVYTTLFLKLLASLAKHLIAMGLLPEVAGVKKGKG